MFFLIVPARSSKFYEKDQEWVKGEWDLYEPIGNLPDFQKLPVLSVEIHTNPSNGILEGSLWRNDNRPSLAISKVSDFNLENFEIGFPEKGIGEVYSLDEQRTFITKLDCLPGINENYIVSGNALDHQKFQIDFINSSAAIVYITKEGKISVDQYFAYKMFSNEEISGKLNKLLMFVLIGFVLQMVVDRISKFIEPYKQITIQAKTVQHQQRSFLEKGRVHYD